MSYSGIRRGNMSNKSTQRGEQSNSTPNRSRPTNINQPSSSTQPRSSPAYAPTSIPRRGLNAPIIHNTPNQPPKNANSAAFDSHKSVEARRQEAIALKRRREIETAPGYKSMESTIKKYKYTGPDPRDEVVAGSSGKLGDDGKGREGGVVMNQLRGGGDRTKEWVRDVAKKEYEQEGDEELSTTVDYDDVIGLSDDDEKDDMFDSILSANSKGNSKKHTLEPIKPFRSIQVQTANSTSRPMAPTQQDQSRAWPTPKVLPQAPPRPVPTPAPIPAISNSQRPRYGYGNPSTRPTTTNSKPKKIKNPSRWNPPAPPAPPHGQSTRMWQKREQDKVDEDDEYGDDAFDQLLATTTTFDDGTDMYADPGFDEALEAALANGAGW